ncbi:hypothetical protein K437DRAFT_56995 [Tilletiaria anomala UBC 951]|uniref:DH domain-containing protein n=1 Tax=Tilletiaria anomala (strain ATCC 24038 / CBS 436.72 / UBC 951) TaxID=1037660 RepID=A0A066VC88_TILAU|nr:uncharacterized protein K437DRAFT_56995 [Tilletiaria anomala UBC 951]KDN36359.1 hypothetical protein K437DRAFT_56995 [Tilletiaria anomala UBC 951]
MKKFLSRFNGAPVPGFVDAAPAEACTEKVALFTSDGRGHVAANASAPPQPPAKDRVRAMAARFEELSSAATATSSGATTTVAGVGAPPLPRPQAAAFSSSAGLNGPERRPEREKETAGGTASAPSSPPPLSPTSMDNGRDVAHVAIINDPMASSRSASGAPALLSDMPLSTASAPASAHAHAAAGDKAPLAQRRRPLTPDAPSSTGMASKQVAFAPSPIKPSTQREQRFGSATASGGGGYAFLDFAGAAASSSTPSSTPPASVSAATVVSDSNLGFPRPASSSWARPAPAHDLASLGIGRPSSRQQLSANGANDDGASSGYASAVGVMRSKLVSASATSASEGTATAADAATAGDNHVPSASASRKGRRSSASASASASATGYGSSAVEKRAHSNSASSAPPAPMIHLTHQDAFAHLPAQNSIPFASALGVHRSTSPLSVAPSVSAHALSAAPATAASAGRRSSGPALVPALSLSSGLPHRPSTCSDGEPAPTPNGAAHDAFSLRSYRSRAGSSGGGGGAADRFGSVGAKSIGAPSWSEMTEEELVLNLGSRERTRQEVLWEIVASEERYVLELEKMKDLYVDALLHPLRFSPPASPPPASPRESMHQQAALMQMHLSASASNSVSARSSQQLPIASRFASSAFGEGGTKLGLPSSPAFTGGRRTSSGGVGMMALSHSGSGGVGPSNFARGLGIAMPSSGSPDGSDARALAAQLRRKTTRRTSASVFGMAVPPTSSQASKPGDPFNLGINVPLPESLRLVLESLTQGLLEAHEQLSEALKARYEAQWPLVRTLADIFMRYSFILKHYATYVCHLQRALEQIDEAMLMERAMRGKRIKKEKLSQTVALGRAIAVLEAFALDYGEPGLAIFISKPFQRLLKYPLLFQNLLFHTDPSTHEFESTVEMVVEVERIVRSIEDEKVSAEERDKARDAFARIDGVADRRLLKPRGDRFLIEEKPLYDEAPKRALSENSPSVPHSNSNGSMRPSGSTGNASDSEVAELTSPAQRSLRDSLRSKRSYRRLSDFLATDPKQQKSKAPNMGSKKDIWIVKFSDVELRCQRVGVTALPMASSVAIRPTGPAQSLDGAADFGSLASSAKDSKDRLKALRNTTLRAKTRNLYKFIAIQSWKAAEKPEESHSVNEETLLEEAEVEKTDSDASSEDVIELDRYVRQSKLSFSYWGHDKVEPRPQSATSQPTRRQSPLLSNVAAFRSQQQQQQQHRTASPSSNTSHALARVSSGTAFIDPSSVVSNSHSKARVDKFAGRLRESGSPPSAAASRRTSVALDIDRPASRGAAAVAADTSKTSLVRPKAQLPRNNSSLISVEAGVPFSPSGLSWPNSPSKA